MIRRFINLNMKRKRSPTQTKLNFQVANKYKTCPECDKEMYYKLLDFHIGSSDCIKNINSIANTQKKAPIITQSPLPSTRTMQRSFISPPPTINAYDVLMNTPQTKIIQNFHLTFLGESGGRKQWDFAIDNKEIGDFISRKHFLKESSKDPCQIILTASTSHSSRNPLSFYDFIRLQGFSPGILKSCLQKSIRQGIRNKAIRLALQMAVNCGLKELCRRLCVIVLEDCFLHPDYPLLAWCMVAGDEYQYSQEILDSVIQIVADVSTLNYRDVLYIESSSSLFKQWSTSNEIVKAMLIRAYYKGMKGDIEMLSKYSAQWMERFRADSEWMDFIRKVHYKLPVWTLEEIRGGLRVEDVPLQGIDFNCSNMLDILLQDDIFMFQLEEALNRPRKTIKEYLCETIWTQRGGVNYRKYITDYPSTLTVNLQAPENNFEPDPVFVKLVLPRLNELSYKEIVRKFKISQKAMKNKIQGNKEN
ncbi:unnamed protein product [Blepharisma stoltei]|uniref:Uncharacterized protein n=1 Tax=Blepharisma stoltei TaxID=1481888 RepID=A0AAU9JCP3_9CILI|nr:unnamed protein product [Blepharisma stoltei]